MRPVLTTLITLPNLSPLHFYSWPPSPVYFLPISIVCITFAHLITFTKQVIYYLYVCLCLLERAPWGQPACLWQCLAQSRCKISICSEIINALTCTHRHTDARPHIHIFLTFSFSVMLFFIPTFPHTFWSYPTVKGWIFVSSCQIPMLKSYYQV